MQRIKNMTSSLEITRINPSTQSSPLTNQSGEKLYLGTVVLTKKNDITKCALFQTVVTGSDESSAMTRMILVLRDECESYSDDHDIRFKGLYEVTPDSPEYFTLTKYFK